MNTGVDRKTWLLARTTQITIGRRESQFAPVCDTLPVEQMQADGGGTMREGV